MKTEWIHLRATLLDDASDVGRRSRAAVEMQCIGQTPSRFDGIGLELEHQVLHAELGIAMHGVRELRDRARQWCIEECGPLRLQVREPQADQSGDSEG